MGGNIISGSHASPAVATHGNPGGQLVEIIERVAMNPDLPIEKLGQILDFQERIINRQAMEAFNASLAEMQSELPAVTERGKAHNTKYATFEDINDTARPYMSKHGFGMSFRVKSGQGAIEITGILMHKMGHREETTLVLPADTSGSKNNVQAVGSSVSYGKRYVMCAMLNIATRGEDDDGHSSAPSKLVTSRQAAQISALAERKGEAATKYIAEKYGDASMIPALHFNTICNRLAAQDKTDAD